MHYHHHSELLLLDDVLSLLLAAADGFSEDTLRLSLVAAADGCP